MPGDLVRQERGGGCVGAFRRGALLLILVALPLLALWLLEGNIMAGIRPSSRQQREMALIATHRIAGWLVPLVLGAVFAHGISRTEPDVRLAAMGLRDPRRLWLKRWSPVAGVFLAVVASIALALSLWSGESALRLVGATVSASAFALAVGYALSTVTGATPGVAGFATTVIVAGTMLAPPQLGLAAPMSLSPGPLGWLRGEPYRWEMAAHTLAVAAVAAAVTFGAASAPRDVRDVRWIARFRGKDA